MKTADTLQISRLSVPEKLRLIEALWDDVREDAELPLPEWHRQALDESAATYNQNPRDGEPWCDVKARLLSRVK